MTASDVGVISFALSQTEAVTFLGSAHAEGICTRSDRVGQTCAYSRKKTRPRS